MSVTLIIVTLYQVYKTKTDPHKNMFPSFILQLYMMILVVNVGVILFQLAYTINNYCFSEWWVAFYSIVIAVQLYYLSLTYWSVSLSYYKASLNIPKQILDSNADRLDKDIDEHQQQI